MKILSYKVSGFSHQDWHFNKVELGDLNLLVGTTASGKTRFLNTIFNLAVSATAEKIGFDGRWDMTFSINQKTYDWTLESRRMPDGQIVISMESLRELTNNINTRPIIERSKDVFIFNEQKLPKLSNTVVSISLLKAEEQIRPLFEGFSLVTRRDFSAFSGNAISEYSIFSPDDYSRMQGDHFLGNVFRMQSGVSAKLFVLSKNHPQIFKEIISTFKQVFPFVSDTQIVDLSELNPNAGLPGRTPIFCIKERDVNNAIPLPEMSSGMRKVLMILTDIYTMPLGTVYLIDEYENSLGINAIDFLPPLLLEHASQCQFIITSHHPQLINRIPVKDWYIFHRKGVGVTIKHGPELEFRFGKSKQQIFLQLLNDPFYTEGIE